MVLYTAIYCFYSVFSSIHMSDTIILIFVLVNVVIGISAGLFALERNSISERTACQNFYKAKSLIIFLGLLSVACSLSEFRQMSELSRAIVTILTINSISMFCGGGGGEGKVIPFKISELISDLDDSGKFVPKICRDPVSFQVSDFSDLYIIDIDIPDRSGFEIAREINQIAPNSRVIFCSNHEDLVFRSFSLNVFFFIRKANLKDDLAEGLKKFLKVSENNSLMVDSSVESVRVPYSRITCLVVYGNQVVIRCRDRAEYMIRNTLKNVESTLPAELFSFASSSVIVNVSQIEKISGSTIYMKDGSHFESSRRKLGTLKSRYSEYRLNCIL